jgi:DNA polymerase-3 subunit delta'
VRFRDVQHQERALSILRRALRSGRTPHAYLFEGPEGVGKELAARALAARLLCGSIDRTADADACGGCQACRLMAAGNHPDFHLIHRGLHKVHPDRSVRISKGLELVVDLIRHFLIEPAASKPSLGRQHVFVIRQAERMNDQAQNALLKTLEEPPGQTRLVLVTASAERLLPTIRSRCQRVPFGLLPLEFVQDQLTAQLGLAPAAAGALARLADGRLGAAIRWHHLGLLETLAEIGPALDGIGQADPESFGRTLVEVATSLALRGSQPANETAEEEERPAEDDEDSGEAARSGAKPVPTDELRDALKLALRLIAALYHDALLESVAADAALHLPGQRQRVQRLAAGASPETLDSCLRAVMYAERLLDSNVAPQLVGERLAGALSGAAPVP